MSGIPKAAWAILVVALILRLGATALLTDELEPGADELAYRTIAASVATGDGFPDRPGVAGGGPSASNPPGYPYALGALFALSGDSVELARVVDALLGVLTVALVGLVAWQIFASRTIALAALAIAAVYPPLIVIGAPLMTESLLLPLLLGMVACALRLRAGGGIRWAALMGALGGAAILTKDVGLVAFVVVGVAVWARPRLELRSLAAPGLAIVVALLVVTPWQIRNTAAFDSFVPVSTKLGLGLAGSYNETVRADPDHVWAPPYQLAELRPVLYGTDLDEAEISRELQDRALDFISEHPGYPFALAGRNLLRMVQLGATAPGNADAELLGFNGDASDDGLFRAVWWICAAAFAALAIAAIVAVGRGWARPIPAFLWILALLAILPLIFIAAGPRYRLPVDLVLVLAAATVVASLSRATSNEQRAMRGGGD